MNIELATAEFEAARCAAIARDQLWLIERLTRKRDDLLTALQRLVTLYDGDSENDHFLAMAEDAAERGMTEPQYKAELMEQARAAIAKATQS